MADRDEIRRLHPGNATPLATFPEGDTQAQGEVRNTPYLAAGSTGGSLDDGVRGDPKWARKRADAPAEHEREMALH